MTKPITHKACKTCGSTFKKLYRHQIYCDIDCAFLSRCKENGECIEWVGSKHLFGYGEFRYNRILYRAHKFAYERLYGAVTNNIGINHVCDNPACVNPEHLYAGTQAENMADVRVRERSPNTKFSSTDVVDILKMLAAGFTQTEIAKKYNVSQTTIHYIKYKKTWSHISI